MEFANAQGKRGAHASVFVGQNVLFHFRVGYSCLEAGRLNQSAYGIVCNLYKGNVYGGFGPAYGSLQYGPDAAGLFADMGMDFELWVKWLRARIELNTFVNYAHSMRGEFQVGLSAVF